MSNIIEVNSGNFKAEVLESPLPILVDAYSPDCGPCRAAAPILEELAEEVRGRAKIVKVDAVEDVFLAAALRVAAYPSFIVFRDGREVARLVGLRTKKQLREALERAS